MSKYKEIQDKEVENVASGTKGKNGTSRKNHFQDRNISLIWKRKTQVSCLNKLQIL